LEGIAINLELDSSRFKLVGLSFYGTTPSLSLICVDLKSDSEEEKIVSMIYDKEIPEDIFSRLFKRLAIVFYDKHDTKYSEMKYSEEVRFSGFHEE
jgi:hypothetical protein